VNLKPAALFMYFTGARKGSVKKVTWSMVSKDNTQITMPGRINKNRKPHVIPLVGPLEPIVNMLTEISKSFPKPEDHVFDFRNHRNQTADDVRDALIKVGSTSPKPLRGLGSGLRF